MAVVTAVITQARVDGDDSARAVLASYYPGLGVVAGTAALGLAIAVSGALRRQASHAPAPLASRSRITTR
jgi:hypothetical protein